MTAGPSLEGIASLVSGVSTFFMIYLSLEACVSLPFSLLARVPTLVIAWLHKRSGRRAPNVTPPEYLPYDVIWAQTFLAAGVGLLFATSSPAILPFAGFHLVVSYGLLTRSVLYSLSRGWLAGKHDGGKGLMWAAASGWLLGLLAASQLLLAGLHLAQLEYLTFGCLVPLPAIAYLAHARFERELAPQLRLLPMDACVRADNPPPHTPPPHPTPTALGVAEQSERSPTIAQPPTAELTQAAPAGALADPFTDDTYLQPELQAVAWRSLHAGRPPPQKPGDWHAPPPCLRVAVLGASGAVGHHVVAQALAAGHTVVALAREPREVTPSRHRRLRKFAVDVASATPADLAPLLKNAHFVISCLGNRRGEPQVVHRGTATLLAAMVAAGVPRMAMVSCIGVGDSGVQLRRLGGFSWLYSLIFSTVLHADRQDLAAAEAECLGMPTASDVVGVVVRAADLHDRNGTRRYTTGTVDEVVGPTIAREDVAHFLLTLVHSREHDGCAVSLGGAMAAADSAAANSAATDGAAATANGTAATEPADTDGRALERAEEASSRVPELEHKVQQLEERLRRVSEASGGQAAPASAREKRGSTMRGRLGLRREPAQAASSGRSHVEDHRASTLPAAPPPAPCPRLRPHPRRKSHRLGLGWFDSSHRSDAASSMRSGWSLYFPLSEHGVADVDLPVHVMLRKRL